MPNEEDIMLLILILHLQKNKLCQLLINYVCTKLQKHIQLILNKRYIIINLIVIKNANKIDYFDNAIMCTYSQYNHYLRSKHMINKIDNVCPGCDKEISQKQLRNHVQKCHKYPATILKDAERLKKDRNAPKNVVNFLRYQLEIALEIIKKIQSANGGMDIQMQNYSNLLGQIDLQMKNSKDQKSPIKKPKEEINFAYYEARLVVCKGCDRKFYQNNDRDMLITIFGCWHIFCLPCINKYIDSEFVNNGGSLKCLDQTCRTDIQTEQILAIIGKEKYEIIYNKALRKMYNLISCCKCKSEFQFAEGNPKDAPKKDPQNNPLKPEHAKDYAMNRFVCPSAACKTEQCRSCQAFPYHLGMTCKQYKDRALLKKCRYCDEPLTQKNFFKTNEKALADICNQAECQQSAKMACTKINPCGHPCYGYRGEGKCLPCLNQKCAQKNQLLKGVNGDQYCAICYVQALSAAPCVMSGCGHIFHVKCLRKRFEIKWLTPRIFFNFCYCPLCKKWITVTPDSELYKPSEQFRLLRQKIETMAFDRLKFEELQKSDEKLKEKSSPYFGKPKEYANIIYAYFMCFKCKNPYFGGRKDCIAAMNQAQNAGGSFKADQLICPNCCQIPVQNCPKHGKDFIQFKCKFCCSIAQWFCWGNTHFCQPCHKRQCDGDYVSKYTKQQLPKCLEAKGCPVGGKHNGNGQQKMLGCAICRNYKQNHKSF